jgi:uncharacterized RDD family membrane protein YckC
LVDGAAALGVMLPAAACLVAAIIVVAGSGKDQGPPPLFTVLLLASLALFVLGLAALEIYQIVLLAQRGQTIGKRVMNIRIVKFENDGEPGIVHAWVLRALVPGVISSLPFGIGAVFSLADILFIFREDRRCIHDLIAGTKVVQL